MQGPAKPLNTTELENLDECRPLFLFTGSKNKTILGGSRTLFLVQVKIRIFWVEVAPNFFVYLVKPKSHPKFQGHKGQKGQRAKNSILIRLSGHLTVRRKKCQNPALDMLPLKTLSPSEL